MSNTFELFTLFR